MLDGNHLQLYSFRNVRQLCTNVRVIGIIFWRKARSCRFFATLLCVTRFASEEAVICCKGVVYERKGHFLCIFHAQ